MQSSAKAPLDSTREKAVIVQNNDHPLNSIYYLTYRLLMVLKQKDGSTHDIDELFDTLNKTLKKKISFAKFLLLIDWLHLNDSVEVQEDGSVTIDVFDKH